MTGTLDSRTPGGASARGRKRVLLVTYPFPPTGGAGVQRVTKFVKYLPRHGWDVSVLTVANPSVPLRDDSLQKDVPPETLVRRARSWEPGYATKASIAAEPGAGPGRGSFRRLVRSSLRRVGTFLLQPDPQILWMPRAVAAGKRLLRHTRHDAILASGPPFSTFLIGTELGRSAGLPVVLDYRDEWTISNAYWENKRLDPVSRYVQGRMQRRVIRAAGGLLATTRCSAEALAALKREAGGKARVTWVYNGFDPDDFGDQPPAPPADGGRFRLAYIGTLWNLTDVGPLVGAVRQVAHARPDLAGRLELVFAGRRTGPQAELLASLRGLPCRLIEYPYLEHTEAVRLMRGSEALCLLLSDLPGAGRVVPAKLFEYVAAARPALVVAPHGEAWDLLDGYPGGRFLPGDTDGIAAWLTTTLSGHRAGGPRAVTAWNASAFTREAQAGQLAGFLGELATGPAAGSPSATRPRTNI